VYQVGINKGITLIQGFNTQAIKVEYMISGHVLDICAVLGYYAM